MLNTQADYNTFDNSAVKNKKQTKKYKLSCLLVVLLISALIGVALYWSEILGMPGKVVKISRQAKLSKESNKLQAKDEVSDPANHMMNGALKTMAVSDVRGMISTLVDKAEAEVGGVQGEVAAIEGEAQHYINEAKQLYSTLIDRLENIQETLNRVRHTSNTDKATDKK
jgi:hypothetical protein